MGPQLEHGESPYPDSSISNNNKLADLVGMICEDFHDPLLFDLKHFIAGQLRNLL